MHRDPDESVETEDEVDAARKGVEVGFQTREEGGRESDEVTVLELDGRKKERKRSAREDEHLERRWKDATRKERTFPYLSERVCNDMVPSPINDCTSATSSCEEERRRRRERIRRARNEEERNGAHVSLLEEPERRERKEVESATDLEKISRRTKLTHCRICSSSDSSFLLY